MSLSVGVSWTQDTNGDTDRQLALNGQIPLSLFSDDSWVNAGMNFLRPAASSQSLSQRRSAG